MHSSNPWYAKQNLYRAVFIVRNKDARKLFQVTFPWARLCNFALAQVHVSSLLSHGAATRKLKSKQ